MIWLIVIVTFVAVMIFGSGVQMFDENKVVRGICLGIAGVFMLLLMGLTLEKRLYGDREIFVKSIEFGQIYERADAQYLETATQVGTNGTCIHLCKVSPGVATKQEDTTTFFIPQGGWYPATNQLAVCVKYKDGTKRLAPYTMPSTNAMAEVTGK